MGINFDRQVESDRTVLLEDLSEPIPERSSFQGHCWL